MCGFDYDQPVSEKAADGVRDAAGSSRADDAFVPFDLFPPPSTNDEAGSASSVNGSPGGMLTGAMVVAGILAVFVALLVLRPLG
jgi:hypothetical protein